MYRLEQETPDDWWEVEGLFDLCFVPGREALSSYRLRDGIAPVADLCLVARDEHETLSGAIRFWPTKIKNAPILLLGPVAVHPTRQGEGLGALLIEESLALAQDWRRVLLVGDEPYYGRFGFHRLSGVKMPPPTNPDRILGRELDPGAWKGISGHVVRWI